MAGAILPPAHIAMVVVSVLLISVGAASAACWRDAAHIRLTYGRAMGKATWTSLTLTLRAGTSLWATGLWRTMLSEGIAPFGFRAPPPPAAPDADFSLPRPASASCGNGNYDCDHKLSRRSRSIYCERRAPRRR